MTSFFKFTRGSHLFEIFKIAAGDGALYAGYHDGQHVCTAGDAEIVVRTFFRECIPSQQAKAA